MEFTDVHKQTLSATRA